MDNKEFDGVLEATLEDRRLSRGERHALRELVAEANPTSQRLAFFRHRAFAIAKETMSGRENQLVLEWLEDVIKALAAPAESAMATNAEVLFSPGEDCLQALLQQLEAVKSTADICVFTITDNRLARAIEDTHRRGVKVRIITDDEKAYDKGSDAHRLANAGLAVRYDHSPHHMHHKFAVYDAHTVVTGSYNWTRSAAANNRENLLISDDRRLVTPYRDMFERMWSEMAP